MNKFVRVMHPKEAEEIQKTGFVPTNRESWGEHKAGSVVFLFDGDRVLWNYIQSRAEDLIEQCGEAIILSFEGFFPHDADKSGWDKGGAVVHKGPIPLSDISKIRWFRKAS